ncbi:MAG: hypothetical protein QW468_04400 [Candidatus Bathyarchaeia archaeon]
MNRWSIVFAATGFNLLFEYSMRGINDLVLRPLLPPFLFAVYFPYFALLEDLITKYRLKDYNIVIAGFFFGTVFTLFMPATQFVDPQALGINWTAFFFINFCWWGMIQGVLTFYIATRLFPRDWNHTLLSRPQKTALFLTLVFAGLLFRISIQINTPQAPQIHPQAYMIIAIIAVLTALIFKKTIPKQAIKPAQQKETVMDALSALTIAVFTFSAVFLTHDPTQINVHSVNATAVRMVIPWTIIATLIMVGYRLYKRHPIPI